MKIHEGNGLQTLLQGASRALMIFDTMLKESQAQYNRYPSNDVLIIMTALNDARKTHIEHTLTCLRSELSHSASEW